MVSAYGCEIYTNTNAVHNHTNNFTQYLKEVRMNSTIMCSGAILASSVAVW